MIKISVFNSFTFEKADSVGIHLLEVMAIMGILLQIKVDSAPAYVSSKMNYFLIHDNIKHITGIPHNPIQFMVCVQRFNYTDIKMDKPLTSRYEWKWKTYQNLAKALNLVWSIQARWTKHPKIIK